MGMLEDMLKALERIPIWKRVAALPERHDSLEARVKALEEKLAGPRADECPVCGARAFKRVGSKPHRAMGDLGVMDDQYMCAECNHEERRVRAPPT